MKYIILYSMIAFMISCGDPKGPGKKAGDEANSEKINNNDYPSKTDTTIDMSSGGGVGTDIYKADSIANKGKESGGKGH
jgi:hypothetical protein